MTSVERPSGGLSTLSREGESAIPRPGFAWKTRVLIPGLILLALLLLIGYTAKDALLPARGVRVVPVVVKSGGGSGAGNGAMSSGVSVQAPGWVEADPYPISVSALADGIVKEMVALEGQVVKKGDVVARLVDEDAKLGLARAEADVAEKEARLEAAQRSWDNPVERVRAVSSGEAQVAETKADLIRIDADIAAERAKLAVMKFEAERMAETFKTRASSEFETVRAQRLYEAQQANVEASEARKKVMEAQLAARSADLVAAKENLRLRIDDARMLAEGKAQLQLAKAARDEAALRLARMEVRSPADGIVMQRMSEPGAKLVMNMDDPHSAHAVRLYDPKHLQVRVDVPLADAAKVGVDQPAEIVVGVLPDKTFKGKVTRVVSEADIQKNTLQVKVAITDPSPQLKPEMLARVKFGAMAIVGEEHADHSQHAQSGGAQSVWAPVSLIHRMGDSAMAWVVDPRKSTASHRTIQTSTSEQDGWVAVTAGLFPGDQLIADNEGLSDGQRVRVVGEADLASVKSTKTSGGKHESH